MRNSRLYAKQAHVFYRASLCATNQGYSRTFFCIAVIPFWVLQSPSLIFEVAPHPVSMNIARIRWNHLLITSWCLVFIAGFYKLFGWPILALDRIYHPFHPFFSVQSHMFGLLWTPHVCEKIPPFLPTFLPIIFAHHVCLCEKYLCPSPHWPSLPKRQETLHDSDLFLCGGGLQES